MKNLKYTLLLGLLSAALFWTACTPEAVDPNGELKTQVVSNYCDIIYANYEDSYNKALDLQTAINTLVTTPNQANFDAAKTIWTDAISVYSETEISRYFDSPIDDANGPEVKINGWPMDENFIDYTRNAAGTAIVYTGIIHDLAGYPTIDAAVIEAANEAGGEKNISMGFHAIEFLLWGQDHIDVNVNVGQGGDRSYTDYTSAAVNYDRRIDYIQACAQMLVDDLAYVKDAWAPTGNYRTFFQGINANDAITKLLTGAGVISKSELSGERMFTALETNSFDNPQEDELCCFSDQTHLTLLGNAQGVSNVLTGIYTNTNGVNVGNTSHSILALLEKINSIKSSELLTINTATMLKMNAIAIPFDKTVTEEDVTDNGPILEAVLELQEQGDKIKIAAAILGLEISTALPQ